MVRHPIQTANGIRTAVAHPIQTGKAIYSSVKTTIEEDVINGNADTRARFAGKVANYLDEAATLADDAVRLGDDIVEGITNANYATSIDNQVSLVQQTDLPDWIKDSFTNGVYRTVDTSEPITLYRTFGGKAEAGGAFASTQPVFNRIQAKIENALLPEWGNSRMMKLLSKFRKGKMLNIGKVKRQITLTGTELMGGADQVLLPENWPLEWIKEYVMFQVNKCV